MRAAGFARNGLGYSLRVAEAAAELAVSRLGMTRGETWGELVVSCAMPGIGSSSGHVFRGRVNLSSPSSRSTLAKHLASRTAGAEIDWPEVLETLCVQVLSAEAEGPPFLHVGRMPQRLPDPFLVDPLLPTNKTTILFGDGGVGKSFFAIGIAVSVATGSTVIGGFVPRHQAPVLYLDWETDAAEIDSRLKAVSAGAEMEPPEMGYRACVGSLAGQIEEILRYVQSESVGLVIVDSVGMAVATSSDGGDANESVIRLFTALRHLNATVLAIDHVNKSAAALEGGALKPYGSTYKVNLARSVWELRQGKEADAGVLHLGLYHRKANTMRLLSPLGFAFEHDGEQIHWTSEQITEESLEKGLSLSKRVAHAVGESALTDQEIADLLGSTVQDIRVYLSRGKKAGRYVKLGDGRWGLAYVGKVG